MKVSAHLRKKPCLIRNDFSQQLLPLNVKNINIVELNKSLYQDCNLWWVNYYYYFFFFWLSSQLNLKETNLHKALNFCITLKRILNISQTHRLEKLLEGGWIGECMKRFKTAFSIPAGNWCISSWQLDQPVREELDQTPERKQWLVCGVCVLLNTVAHVDSFRMLLGPFEAPWQFHLKNVSQCNT